MIERLCWLFCIAFACVALYSAASPDGKDEMLWPTHRSRLASGMPPKVRPR